MTAPTLYCAIDVGDLGRAYGLAETVAPHVDGLKLGLEFFCALGSEGVRHIAALGAPIFLDLKLHDIPNTVAGALHSLMTLSPAYVTLHCQGGEAMMRRAREEAASAAAKLGVPRPRLLGVTVLTSLDAADLAAQGLADGPDGQVPRLARLAQRAGLDGLVCSAGELAAVRDTVGADMHLAVPGIRPDGAGKGDQKRVMTPQAAAKAGADILVVGRPITDAANPAAAAEAIRQTLLPPAA